jgi:hypothetical protein
MNRASRAPSASTAQTHKPRLPTGYPAGFVVAASTSCLSFNKCCISTLRLSLPASATCTKNVRRLQPCKQLCVTLKFPQGNPDFSSALPSDFLRVTLLEQGGMQMRWVEKPISAAAFRVVLARSRVSSSLMKSHPISSDIPSESMVYLIPITWGSHRDSDEIPFLNAKLSARESPPKPWSDERCRFPVHALLPSSGLEHFLIPLLPCYDETGRKSSEIFLAFSPIMGRPGDG